jgi:hypothetical protein
MPLEITGYTVRVGRTFARGTDIDAYLEENEVKALYERWKPAWPTPLEFSGGIKAITCEMVLEVPEKEFRSTFRKMADHILEAAKRNVGR